MQRNGSTTIIIIIDTFIKNPRDSQYVTIKTAESKGTHHYEGVMDAVEVEVEEEEEEEAADLGVFIFENSRSRRSSAPPWIPKYF